MQKFQKGDLVMIAEDLGPCKSHFTSGCKAIVLEFGWNSYSVYIENEGAVAWYEEYELTLIEPNRLDMLQQWEDKAQADHLQKSNLDWVFANGDEVIKQGHSASIEALASCFEFDFNMWGSHGEGFTHYQNTLSILERAKPFLSNGDKKGWLELAKTISNIKGD